MTWRVGIVCFATVGGSGTVGVELAHALAERGHDVTVFSSAKPARLPANVAFHAIPALEHPLFPDSPYALALASALVAAHRTQPFDVVHLHYGVPQATSALLARLTLGVQGPAFVVTLHGSDVVTFGTPDTHGPVLSAALRRLDAVTTPSAYLAEVASNSLGITAAVVPNAVDTRVFRPSAAEPARLASVFGPRTAPTLVHVSNLRPVKATRALVPMLCALHDTPARLLVVGDGPERQQLESDAHAAGLGARVRFVAPPPSAAILAAWVASCDVFVLPSENESFGLAALEALACGVPVVARHVGGLSEVVSHGRTGLLVPPPGELASAVRELLDDATRRRAMGAAAAHDAETRFGRDAITDQYERVYARAIDARPAQDAADVREEE